MPHPSLSLRRDSRASWEHATATSPFPHSSSEEGNPGRNTQRGNNEANDNEEAEERALGWQREFRLFTTFHVRIYYGPYPCRFLFLATIRYVRRYERKRVLYVLMHTFVPELTRVFFVSRQTRMNTFVRVSNIVTL